MRETSNYSISRTAEVRDPYARWCGRGEAVRLPPIPIRAENIYKKIILKVSVATL